MKRKGFTLIELLAVIVILAIIALIAVPMVLNTIEKSKEGALKGSAYGVIEAATLYYARNAENPEIKEFVLKDGTFKAGEETLEIKGEVQGTGSVIIDKQGVITLCINDDKRYAYKSYNTDVVSVGSGDTCKIEENILTNKYVAYLTGEDGSSSLDSYYTKEEVDALIAEYATKSELNNYATNEAVGTVLQSYATTSQLNDYVKSDTLTNYSGIRTTLWDAGKEFVASSSTSTYNQSIGIPDISNYTYIEFQYDAYGISGGGYFGESTELIAVDQIKFNNSNTINYGDSSVIMLNVPWAEHGITLAVWFKNDTTLMVGNSRSTSSDWTKIRIRKILGIK